MMKVCSVCGKEFEHVQQGRGRPPKKCRDCRSSLSPVAAETPSETPRERRIVAGTPSEGDMVVHDAFPVAYATPVKLLRVDGEKAVVLNGGEEMETRFRRLRLFSY